MLDCFGEAGAGKRAVYIAEFWICKVRRRNPKKIPEIETL
jgi:hypothetical protein